MDPLRSSVDLLCAAHRQRAGCEECARLRRRLPNLTRVGGGSQFLRHHCQPGGGGRCVPDSRHRPHAHVARLLCQSAPSRQERLSAQSAPPAPARRRPVGALLKFETSCGAFAYCCRNAQVDGMRIEGFGGLCKSAPRAPVYLPLCRLHRSATSGTSRHFLICPACILASSSTLRGSLSRPLHRGCWVLFLAVSLAVRSARFQPKRTAGRFCVVCVRAMKSCLEIRTQIGTSGQLTNIKQRPAQRSVNYACVD
jgi:hypothetical protein